MALATRFECLCVHPLAIIRYPECQVPGAVGELDLHSRCRGMRQGIGNRLSTHQQNLFEGHGINLPRYTNNPQLEPGVRRARQDISKLPKTLFEAGIRLVLASQVAYP